MITTFNRRKPNIRTQDDIVELLDILTRFRAGKIKDRVVRAYKYVEKHTYASPWPGSTNWKHTCAFDANVRQHRSRVLHYTPGSCHEVLTADTDESKDCAEGIHVTSLELAQFPYEYPRLGISYKELQAVALEFNLSDIAAMHLESCSNRCFSGKFRLFRCKVLGPVNSNGNLVKLV